MWRDHQSLYKIRASFGEHLAHGATYIIASYDGILEPEFVQKRSDGARLPACRVDFLRIRLMLVRLAESAQVRCQHIGNFRQPRNKLIPVGMVSGPTVQKHNRGSRARAFVSEAKAVYRRRILHL